MTITVSQTPWVSLRKGDAGFMLHNDITLCSRAGLEITKTCPQGIAVIIADAMERGWIEPVAMVPRTDPTLMWDYLKK
jgi:hypothetical protein